jgi:hypothetical protein
MNCTECQLQPLTQCVRLGPIGPTMGATGSTGLWHEHRNHCQASQQQSPGLCRRNSSTYMSVPVRPSGHMGNGQHTLLHTLLDPIYTTRIQPWLCCFHTQHTTIIRCGDPSVSIWIKFSSATNHCESYPDHCESYTSLIYSFTGCLTCRRNGKTVSDKLY